MPKVIGLTGGVGSGKSSVATFFDERNTIEVIDADDVCRLLLVPEAKGWLSLRKFLDEKYFLQDKTINRPLLRQSIFTDNYFRTRIDNAIHPLVRQEIFSTIKDHSGKNHENFLVEVPLLFEAGWEDDFDEIVVVFAEQEKRVQRLLARDNITKKEAEAMLRSQMPLDEKVLRADHVVDNNGTWADTCKQLIYLEEALWKKN